MAFRYFPGDLYITDKGLQKLGSLTSFPTFYGGTGATFLSTFGYNGGVFNLADIFNSVALGASLTQKLFTLKNGNYAQVTVNKTLLYSPDTYNLQIRLELFNADNTSTGIFASYGSSTSTSYPVDSRTFSLFCYFPVYDDSTNNFGWFSPYAKTNATYVQPNAPSSISISYATFIGWLLGAKAPDDPYGLNDNNTPGGGYGDFDYTGDDDLPPSLPTLSAAQVGFVSLWNPSQQEMKNLADYLWTGTFDLTNFKKLFTDPMECILSVGIVPVTPTTGTATEIVFGGSSHSGVSAKPITSQFVTVDLGKVHINGQSASALDYSPYAKVSIFLPYCGTYALDADDVMDADVELEYHIDIYTGACVAYLTITKTNSDGSTLHSTLYQFTGNCLASIPITGNDHSQFIQSMLFMGAAVAATVATSGAGAPALEGAAASGDVAGASAVNAVTASSAVNSVMSMKPNVLRSGNLSSTAGLLGKQRPCITVTWPNLCRPDTEYKLLGMPVHKSGTLSDFEGFTIVSAVHVENILCTEIEKQMIEQMLYKGVMV